MYRNLFAFEVEVLYVSGKCWEESLRQNSRSRVRLVVRYCVVVSCGDGSWHKRVLFFTGPWKLFISQTRPRPLPRVTGHIIRFGFASFPFTAWFVGSSRRRFDAPDTERDGITRERGAMGREREKRRKGKCGRKRNSAIDRKKRETRPIRAKLI